MSWERWAALPLIVLCAATTLEKQESRFQRLLRVAGRGVSRSAQGTGGDRGNGIQSSRACRGSGPLRPRRSGAGWLCKQLKNGGRRRSDINGQQRFCGLFCNCQRPLNGCYEKANEPEEWILVIGRQTGGIGGPDLPIKRQNLYGKTTTGAPQETHSRSEGRHCWLSFYIGT